MYFFLPKSGFFEVHAFNIIIYFKTIILKIDIFTLFQDF